MKYSPTTFTILLLTVLSALLIVTGIKMRPGIGIIVAIIGSTSITGAVRTFVILG